MRLLSADYNQVELRVLAHVAGEDVLREIFASGEDVHARPRPRSGLTPTRSAPRSARRRRWSTTGSPTGCRPSGLRTGCRSPARRRPPTSSATSSASRRCSASSTRRSPRRRRRASSTRCSAAGGRSPSCAPSQRQRRSLGERLAVNTVIQGTAADIIKLAMVHCHAALADAGNGDPAGAADPRRASVRGPGGRDGRGREAGRARDVRARSSSTRRWRSTSASARTGSPQSRRLRRERGIDRPTKGGRPNDRPPVPADDGADGYLTSSISSKVC